MAEGKNTAKGPDNNKRLLELETGVALLAGVLGDLGVKVEIGADPIVLVIELAKGQAATIDKQSETIRELSTSAEAAIAAVGRAEKAEGELGDLRAKVQTLADYVAEHHPGAIADPDECALVVAVRIMGDQAAEIGELGVDIDQLEGKLEALGAAGGDVEEATPARERPENARDFGPMFGSLDVLEIGKLREEKAGLEIAFSNGEHEIVELAPIAIEADALQAVEGRYIAPTIHVKGGTHSLELHGASLLHGGEQIAYCQFPKPIELEPGQERRFDRAIMFG